MKRIFLTGASALALLAAPALASNSQSSVTQSNSRNKATVDQTGTTTGGRSTITQSDDDNEATVTQSDDGTGSRPVQSSTIDQS